MASHINFVKPQSLTIRGSSLWGVKSFTIFRWERHGNERRIKDSSSCMNLQLLKDMEWP